MSRPHHKSREAWWAIHLGNVGTLEVWASFEPEAWTWDDLGDCNGTIVDRADVHEDYDRTVSDGRDRMAWIPPTRDALGTFDYARKRGASVQVAAEEEAEAIKRMYDHARALYSEDVYVGTIYVQVVDAGRVVGTATVGMCEVDGRYTVDPEHVGPTARGRLDAKRRKARGPYGADRWPGAHERAGTRGPERRVLEYVLCDWLDKEALDMALANVIEDIEGAGEKVARLALQRAALVARGAAQ